MVVQVQEANTFLHRKVDNLELMKVAYAQVSYTYGHKLAECPPVHA